MTAGNQKTSKTGPVVKVVRELLSISFWLFFVLKMFVIDIDIVLITKYFPNYMWLVEYKFFIFFGTIAVLWLLIGNRIFRSSILYVLGYPGVILFWHLPRLFFKNWTLAFIFLPSVVATLKSFKIRFITSMVGLIACLLIILNIGPLVSALSMTILFAFLAIHYARQFRRAFSSSTFFNDVSYAIEKFWSIMKETTFEKELNAARQYARDSEKYHTKMSAILLNLFVYNRLFLFSAFKLKRIQESRAMDMYLIASLLGTIFVTTVVFAFEYYALNQIDPASFSGTIDRSFYFFFYASFNTLLTVSFGDFTPISTVARLLTSLQLFTWLLIFVILFFVITTIIRERFQQHAIALVRQISSEGAAIEEIILEEYKLSLKDAEEQVKKDSPGIVKLVDYLKMD